MNKVTMKKNLTLYVSGILVIVGLLAALFVTSSVLSSPVIDETIVAEQYEADNSIYFGVGIDNAYEEAVARIDYARDSVEAIESYVEFNQQQIEKLSELNVTTIATEVTFAHPLNEDSFVNFVEQYGLDVNSYTMYAVSGENDIPLNGDIHTIYGAPADGNLIPGDMFDMTLEGVAESAAKEIRFVGWVSLNVNATGEQIQSMSADSDVFLVDVTTLIVESMLTADNLINADVSWLMRRKVLADGFAEVHRPQLAYSLAELGILDLRSPQ